MAVQIVRLLDGSRLFISRTSQWWSTATRIERYMKPVFRRSPKRKFKVTWHHVSVVTQHAPR